MDIATLVGLIAVLLLVLANGFFVASEFALVSVRRSRIDQRANEGDTTVLVVQRSLDHLDGAIAATQLGITMASLALGWIGEPALAHLIEPLFHYIPMIDATIGSHTVAVAISFSIITALHIVLGELAPKTLALQKPEATSIVIARPLEIFSLVFRPIVQLLNGAGNLVVKAFGLKPAGHENVHSVEELELLVQSSAQAGILNSDEAQLLGRVFDFGERSVRQIMTPRVALIAVPETASFHDLLDVAKHTGASRVPIYSGTIDTVIGMIHLKDLFKFVPDSGNGNVPVFDMKPLIRGIYAVPDTLKIDDLFAQMRTQRQQIAVVVDEFGQTAGIVTMEDILEEIVGEVTDEFDPGDQPFVETANGVLVSGLVDVPSFNERFGFHIDENEFDTVGGFVMGTLGRLARVGDSLSLGAYHLHVETLQGRRVKIVRMVRTERETDAEATDD